MKRLLKISINLAIGSIMPIVCWFCMGLIMDKRLINIFSVTYPLQFLYSLLLHIFGTGANISKERDKNPDIVSSSLITGTVITVLIFGTIAANVDIYLDFMGYDIATYKTFSVYSILFFGISVVFYILMERLYFEDKETSASRYCIIFNLLNFCVLIGSAIIFREQTVSVLVTLVTSGVYVLTVFCKLFKKCKFQANFLHNIRYDSCAICSDILFLLIFLFGLKNANSYGAEYIAAINFVALITDTQWDALAAVTAVAKIDLAKERFNYREHLKNAYVLTGIMVLSSIIMLITLYGYYGLNLNLVIKYLMFEIINFVIWARYAINNTIVQLRYSAAKSTCIKLVADVARFIVSLSPTPFCTAIGQVTGAFIQFVGYGLAKRKADRLEKKTL